MWAGNITAADLIQYIKRDPAWDTLEGWYLRDAVFAIELFVRRMANGE